MSSTSTFDLPDYLGSFTRQTNASQSTTATRVYDAFGNLESTTGTPQSPFGFVGSEGYQEDPNSGLKLVGHRYYDPSTGRFLTRDPAKDGRNWYVYANSSPTGEIDTTGDWPDWLKPSAAGVAAGILTWTIWELAHGAHGNHQPPSWHGHPPQQPILGRFHGIFHQGHPHTDPDGTWNLQRHMYDPDE